MSRTRLAAALGVAALTLGATAAAATNTQTVEITVEAAARTVTVSGNVAFTVDVDATNVSQTSETSSISFTNPTGNTPAKIEVVRSADDLGELSLKLNVAEAGDSEYTIPLDDDNIWTGTATAAERPPVADIVAGANESGRTITWTLTGTAPSTGGEIESTFTYTITDNAS